MALRVLLADESTTIKKVMQLALHEYGVEVKAVPVGLDVVPVAKSFNPDIAFVDVLLQKRSGYDVVKDLKTELPEVPVVLMWSGFMELDEQKAGASGADRRLEKPFDADSLRALVKDLVTRTAENKISEYLTFPPLPDFEETPAASAPIGEIYAIPEAGEENWSHQDLSQFKIQTDGEFEEVSFNSPGETTAPAPTASPQAPSMSATPSMSHRPASSALDDVVAEKILREEARQMIEKIVWQVLPEVCERVVKEELNKLLKDVERSI